MTTIAQAAAFLAQEYGAHGMKLQKILYYAQAAALVQRGIALFPEEFQAWRHGPVNREVWEGKLDPTPIPADDQAVLRATWSKYGHLEAYQLSDLTHADAPWREARKGLPDGVGSDRIIHKKVMENFYLCRELVQRTDGSWEHTAPTEEAWKAAKLQLVLRRKQQGRLVGEAREQFMREQVVATQRLEDITVNLPVANG